MKFFYEIVGLRTYLALWVAVSHGLQSAGYLQESNLALKFLLDGHTPVVIFIIVSGFVITNLIITKDEPYPQYIIRRFFRLFPAFFICCVIGLLISGTWSEFVRQVPWQDSLWEKYSRSIFELENEVKENFIKHSILHITMLHGLVPVEILNRASMTFLPAAWSISLEWQFYLLAPIVIGSIRRPKALIVVAFLALLFLTLYRIGALGTYQKLSSIAGASQYFALGIISRLLVEPLSRYNISPLLAVFIAQLGVMGLMSDPLPIMIWTAFYIFMVWQKNSVVLGKIFSLFTTSKPVIVMGEASYSLYLIHRPIQVALGSLSLVYFVPTHSSMIIVQLIAICVAIPVSIAMYIYVERPGIKLGNRLSKRLRNSDAIPTPT